MTPVIAVLIALNGSTRTLELDTRSRKSRLKVNFGDYQPTSYHRIQKVMTPQRQVWVYEETGL